MEKKIQKQEVERPVTVRILELRADLDKAAMKSMLPPFLLEMILNEYLRGISTVARQEYAQDQAQWEETLKAGEKKDG